jgi:hypothetical protein
MPRATKIAPAGEAEAGTLSSLPMEIPSAVRSAYFSGSSCRDSEKDSLSIGPLIADGCQGADPLVFVFFRWPILLFG